jgi:hypothetical protein
VILSPPGRTAPEGSALSWNGLVPWATRFGYSLLGMDFERKSTYKQARSSRPNWVSAQEESRLAIAALLLALAVPPNSIRRRSQSQLGYTGN